MALHFLSHYWDVHDVDDGTLVALKPEELDGQRLSQFADELVDLAHESGRPNLYLDFAAVPTLTPAALAELVRLEGQLRRIGGRLALFSLSPGAADAIAVARLTDALDVRAIPLPHPERAA